MSTLLMLKGLPASGKSTRAKELVEEGWKRVNKDDLRSMIDSGKWSKENETQIIELRDIIIINYLDNGYNVVVDDTNFYEKHEQTLCDIAENCDAEFEVEFIDTPVQECVKRNALRGDKAVPVDSIWGMYRKYVEPFIERPEYDESLKSAYIVDLDGTLAIMGDRGPFDFDKVCIDKENVDVTGIVSSLHYVGAKILIVSGRDDSCMEMTKEWMKDCLIPFDEMFMRTTGDKRKDSIVKKELYENNIKGKYNILGVFDDRDQVVELWRSLGLTCFQVNYGNF